MAMREESESLSQSDFKTMKELAISTYREVWKEFYSWEPGECRQLAASLAQEPPMRPCARALEDIAKAVSEIDLIVPDFEMEASVPIAYPTYEACAPTSNNIALREDELSEFIEIPFIPYADEPNFPVFKYVADSEYFGWSTLMDPDVEMIQLETARRLHFKEGLSFEEIDRFGVLMGLYISNESGLIWDTSQRDALQWPGSFTHMPNLPTDFSCHEDDFLSRVNSSVKYFCPNLNCITPLCRSHHRTYPVMNLDATNPSVTSDSMILCGGTNCSDLCFRSFSGETFRDTVHWDNEGDVDKVTSLLKIMPDMIPCELAVLCRKPCREVFAYRCRIISDSYVHELLDNPIQTRAAPHIPSFKDSDPADYTPTPPCNHKGVCDTHSGCTCIKNLLHCQRSCRCTFECVARWRGCKCGLKAKSKAKGAKGGICSTETCRCLRSKRECDPELCLPCHASSFAADPSKRICQNTKLQHGLGQHLEVKLATYGVGAFATRAIAQHDLIGEYVGEEVDIEASRHELVMNHLHLNYKFDLNDSKLLDGAKAGNETRYINHGSDGRENCVARHLSVNGDHRIGIYATRFIRGGTELLLDYGEKYWKDDAPGL